MKTISNCGYKRSKTPDGHFLHATERMTEMRLSHGPGKGREAESMILSLAMGQAADWKEI